MAELERALSALASIQAATEAAATPLQQQQQQPAGISATAVGQKAGESRSTSPACAAAEGLALYKVFRVYRDAQVVYRLKDRSSKYSEWPHLQVCCNTVLHMACVDPWLGICASLYVLTWPDGHCMLKFKCWLVLFKFMCEAFDKAPGQAFPLFVSGVLQ